MIWILLPAYNEEVSFKPLIEKVKREMEALGARYRVLVVNDGSKDGTKGVLEEMARLVPMEVLTHKYNRGLGETIRDGMEYIAENAQPGDVVVRMDCDDTHDPSYMRAMVAKLNEGYEVAITSRYAPGGGQVGLDAYRMFISRCANLLLKAVFPMRGIKEYTCGYRAYRVSLIQDAIAIFGNRFIDLKGMGFTGTVEKIIKCKMMKARIAEVPFVLRYDQKMSGSKVVTSLTTLGYLVLIAKYAVPWGDLPDIWNKAIAERNRRVYGEDGKRPLPPVDVST